MSVLSPTLAPLAHAGEGAGWQALVTVLAAGVAVVFVLVAVGRITLDEPGDLILPLAGVAIVSSLAPMLSDTLSDAVTWTLPAGAVLLVGLLLAAFTRLDLRIAVASSRRDGETVSGRTFGGRVHRHHCRL